MNADSRTSNDPPHQWSVQAQFTISHPGIDDPNNVPQTHTQHDVDSVHMFYKWNSQPEPMVERNIPNRFQDKTQSFPTYKFQKGNLLFTSEPPRKNQSSGYGSDIFSPNSSINASSPRRPIRPYNQKCRSTCNIVLSTTISEQPEFEETESLADSHCNRAQSLRCQIPTANLENPGAFYGCGDPWCYHGDTNVFKRTSRESTFSSPFENRSKDAAVQTFEMVDKCTSPFLKNEAPLFKQKRVYNSRKPEPVIRKSSQSSFTPDSLENFKPGDHLSRTRAPYVTKKGSESDSKSNDPNKKSRTVHIDVYCTGTEQEESDSNSSSEMESKTASSPQTVFESEQRKITHSRSGNEILPFKLQPDNSLKDTKPEPVADTNDSDIDDNTSTAYPSQISSYSALAGLSSFASTIPSSWSAYSVDNTSLANTSWKDTFSDIDSLNPSRSSIAFTDSLESVPMKGALTQKSESIEEHPESVICPSTTNLNPSDSFEYENSEDRLRIKQMEKAWKKPISRKSPHLERSKYLFQQQKLKEYVEKRFGGITLQKSESKDSDSGSDVSEKGWSFIKDEDKPQELEPVTKTENQCEQQIGSKRSPSILAIQSKLSLNPNLQAPFMMDPGIYTKQRNVAKKFGSVVNVFRKPGHHIGPAKNPECQCDHCRIHYQSFMRGRARSAGDVYPPWLNWKRDLRQLQLPDKPVQK